MGEAPNCHRITFMKINNILRQTRTTNKWRRFYLLNDTIGENRSTKRARMRLIVSASSHARRCPVGRCAIQRISCPVIYFAWNNERSRAVSENCRGKIVFRRLFNGFDVGEGRPPRDNVSPLSDGEIFYRCWIPPRCASITSTCGETREGYHVLSSMPINASQEEQMRKRSTGVSPFALCGLGSVLHMRTRLPPVRLTAWPQDSPCHRRTREAMTEALNNFKQC
jgi:hypothetical protein